jgi:hypothetical protein
VVAVCIRVAIYSYCIDQATEEQRIEIRIISPNPTTSEELATKTKPLSEGKQDEVEKKFLPAESSSTAMAQTISSVPLPSGWLELTTEDNEIYYESMHTDETQWERPTRPSTGILPIVTSTTTTTSTTSKLTAPVVPKVNALPDGWEELKTETGEKFFASIWTDESQWERPTQPAKRPLNKKSAKVLFRPVETTQP